MGFIGNKIHSIIADLKIEELFIRLRRKSNFFRKFVPIGLRRRFSSFGKFVPPSSSYPKDDCYFLTRENTSFKINRSDYVQWRIFYGVRDNALLYAKKCIESNSIVLDIGANCGAFSLKLATYAANGAYSNFHIHAFEPNPQVFKNFTGNVKLNPSVIDVVHLHPFGLGNEVGEKSFQFPETNTGVGRVIHPAADNQFKVAIHRLDDFVEKLNPQKISFIKMIVEGFEPEVLKGARNVLTKYKPPIFFEVTKEWYVENNSSVEEVLSELYSLGYRFKGEFYNDMIPYSESKFSKLYQFNLLADINFK